MAAYDAGEDALGEVAALLAGDEHVGAGRAFGVGQVAVLLDDERCGAAGIMKRTPSMPPTAASVKICT